ncbi:uncharacterized protein LOC135942568 isoform X2 [Cloeon dipterum]|uniref:uncharacterized protein LOC135942568 isoform X2 n=1 Tax=Cloeon dipterum TaxID=197152 RepID=UPI00321FB639
MRKNDAIFRPLGLLSCCFFACGVAYPAELDRLEAICPGHAGLTTLRRRNVLTRLGDKFYYNSFHDADQGGLEFKLSWKEATDWCQRHAMELVSVESQAELLLLRDDLLRFTANLTSPVPFLYWTSGQRVGGDDLWRVEIGQVVADRFRWTGTRDWIRQAQVYKSTKPGDCVALNTYHAYVNSEERIKTYARHCDKRSSFICELERLICLDE